GKAVGTPPPAKGVRTPSDSMLSGRPRDSARRAILAPVRPRRVDRYAGDALEAALDGALSPDCDESIRVRLRGIARENASCLRDALLMLGVAPSADDYHTNRARRLLEAALEDRPVEPPPPDRVLVFEREK